MRLQASQHQQLIDHAVADAPAECCGWIRIVDGGVAEVRPGVNEHDSPMYGYRLDARSMLDAFQAGERGDEVAIYHSHPRSAAEPSQTDVNLAEYPEYLYVIVSPEQESGLAVRAWRIVEGRTTEQPVEVT